jgi:hypothetical protein
VKYIVNELEKSVTSARLILQLPDISELNDFHRYGLQKQAFLANSEKFEWGSRNVGYDISSSQKAS